MSDTCKALNLNWECLRHACITVEEREHMDATFMLLSVVHLFLKETGDPRDPSGGGHVILVLFQNNFHHLNNIAVKLFMNLKSLMQNRKLTLLELTSEATPVRDQFRAIHSTINGVQAPETLVVLSNLNSLTYMGATSADILNLAHYIKQAVGNSTCLLHCTHNKQDGTVDDLNNAFKHMATYVVQVSNLRTGFCKEISGHIRVSNKYRGYQKAHHFLFTSRGVNVFLPGGLSTR